MTRILTAWYERLQARYGRYQWWELLTGTAMVTVCMRFGDLVNLGTGLVLMRWLANAEFGQTSAIMYTVTIPVGAVAGLVSKVATRYMVSDQQSRLMAYVWRWTRWLVGMGILVGVVLFAARAHVRNVFNFTQPGVIYAVIAMIPVVSVQLVWMKVLQGQRRYWQFGLSPTIAALTRLVATMVLLLLGLHVVGALWAMVIAGGAALLWEIAWAARAETRRAADVTAGSGLAYGRRETAAQLWLFLLASLAIPMIMNADMMFVNHFFRETSGGYAAVKMFGLIASYIPQVFGMILFPMVVRNHVLKQDSRWLVSGSMALSLVLVGAIAGMFYFIAEPLFTLVRAEYVGYAGMLPKYALAMGLFTVSTQTLNYALAQDDKRIVYATFALALGQCVVFWYHHATMGGYVDALLVFALAACVVNAVLLWLPRGRAHRVAGPPSGDAVLEPRPE